MDAMMGKDRLYKQVQSNLELLLRQHWLSSARGHSRYFVMNNEHTRSRNSWKARPLLIRVKHAKIALVCFIMEEYFIHSGDTKLVL